MKIPLLALVLLLSGLSVHAQKGSSKAALDSLDAMIGNPFSPKVITRRTYSKLLYKDQQAIGGSIVKEGRAVGSNATIEENGLTVNVGSPILLKYFAVQGTFKATSEEGFVKAFADGEYQKTLGGGGTVLGFLNCFNKSVYSEQTRILLHRKLRSLRYANEGVALKGYSYQGPSNKAGWVDGRTPYKEEDWIKKGVDTLTALVAKRKVFLERGLKNDKALIDKFYANELTTTEKKDTVLLNTYKAYQKAEADAANLLPAKWFSYGKKSEDNFIKKVSNEATRTPFLKAELEKASRKQRQSRLAAYDTIQLKAPWVRRRRVWASVTGLYNVANQPLFDATAPTKAFQGKGYDEYWDNKVALNGLWIYGWGKMYASAGVGTNNMRVFDKDSLKTYQVSSWQHTGSDSVQVVRQGAVYPAFPAKVNYTTLQLQYSLYWTGKIGVDLSLREKFAKNEKTYHAATFGIFYPIKTGESTLLLMPQVKWNTENDKHPWTFGFNLSASIPGFVTTDEKGK